MLSKIVNFYNNLSDDSLFFFWIIMFLVIFLIFITIILVKKNKKLIKLLKEDNTKNNNIEKEETIIKDNIEKEIIKENNLTDTKENSININNNKEIIKENNIINKEEIPVKEDTINKEIPKEDSISTNSKVEKESNLYQKNILRELSSKQPISPLGIERKEEYIERENLDNYNFDNKIDTYYRENNISPLEELEEHYEETDNMKLVDDIVAKLEKEIKSSNIELTEYERKQEEEAIISYDELEKIKDKIYNITDDEETDEFIDELKSLRIDLE